MLSSVPEPKKTVICLTETVHVLGKLLSDMSAVDHEFSVNESQCILNKVPLNKNIHKIRFILIS